jgi:hypothetical protein
LLALLPLLSNRNGDVRATPYALKRPSDSLLKITIVLRDIPANSEYVDVMEQTEELSNKFSNLIRSVSFFHKCKNP